MKGLSLVFQNDYQIVFHTLDKQTGVSMYRQIRLDDLKVMDGEKEICSFGEILRRVAKQIADEKTRDNI